MTWFRLPLFFGACTPRIDPVMGTPVSDGAHARCDRAADRRRNLRSALGVIAALPHLFWFYCIRRVHHDPAGMGVVSEPGPDLLPQAAFGYFHRVRQLAIALLDFWCGASHVCGGDLINAGMVFPCSASGALPSAIKVFNWTATMYKASIALTTPCSTPGLHRLFTSEG